MRIRLAVVDDSAFVRKAIARMFADDSMIEVVGGATSGEELLANLETWRPDVITLDLSMPGIGGLVTLDRIMATQPTPVIILSTHAGRGAPQTIEALHRGATDFIDKQQYSLLDFHALRDVLLEKIRAVATVALEEVEREPARREIGDTPEAVEPKVLVIGASTGGPPAIEQLLADLGPGCPAPILVVQHMPMGFTKAFASRLNAHLPMEVHEAKPGARLRPGVVYIAPGGKHLRLVREGDRLLSEVSSRPSDVAHRPSVHELFISAGKVLGNRVVAVLLTGMGKDGAEAMLQLRQQGATTIAQDEVTSIVWGMPGTAVSLEAAADVYSLREIGGRVREIFSG